MLILVRHAEPEAAPAEDPRTWPLSPAGRRAARQLRDRLPQAGRWVSSTERKARETLECAAVGARRIGQEGRFDEVRRDEPYDDAFRQRRRAWVDGTLDDRHLGWETPEEAAARFDRAVADHAKHGVPLVIATHGMVLTAWLVHARHWLAPEEAGAFWAELAFPDVVMLD